MIDDALVSHAMQANHNVSNFDEIEDIAISFGLTSHSLLESYRESRHFTAVHEALLGLEDSQATLAEYLKHHPNAEVDRPDASGGTPLAWTAKFGWPAAVKTLLQNGADATQMRPCRLGPSPLLHIVIASPPCPRFEADSFEVVRLVAAGADVNGVDHDGWTPLHIAASWSLAPAIKVLGEVGGANLNWEATTMDGEFAMDLAMVDGGQEETLKLLMSRGADEADDDDENFFEAIESL